MAGVPAPVRNRSAAGVTLVIGSACCFGSLGVFGKLAYRLGLTTPQLLSYRFALAAVLLWLAAAVTRQGLPPRRSLVGLAIMGGAGYVGQSAAYFSALHFIPVSTTALLLYTFPVVVTLLATLLFHEPLGWTKIVAVVLACFLASSAAFAQGGGASTTGTISGKITDSSGAVLPGVTVNATSPSMMGVQSTVSDTGEIAPSRDCGKFVTVSCGCLTP